MNRNKFNLLVLALTITLISLTLYSESIDMISYGMGGRLLIAIVAANLLNVSYGIYKNNK